MKPKEEHKCAYEEIAVEIEKRIRAMEKDDYTFPDPMKKMDYACCFFLILLCFMIVIGMVIHCAML